VGLRLAGTVMQIADAIKDFPRDYADDYFNVRPIGQRYVAEQHPTETVALELATALQRVLRNWGAGRRGAPQLRKEQEIAAALLDTSLHSDVTKLSLFSITNLGFDHRFRRLVNGTHSSEVLEDFDMRLLSVLRSFSDLVFLDNTNVTYPMKALLLVSGLMPALDSQVRTGLGIAGLKGVNKTQFLLPEDMRGSDAKKLTRLPFLLGQCWADYSAQFQDGARQANAAALIQEPGRIFDILLFMQARKEKLPLLIFDAGRQPWYDLP